MHVQGAHLIDTAASVKECFVEGSLCVFLHLLVVLGDFASLPDTEWQSWEGPAPE